VAKKQSILGGGPFNREPIVNLEQPNMWTAFDKANRSGWLVVTALLLVMIVIHGTITSALPTLDNSLLAELGISRADLKFRESIFLLSSGLSGLAIGFAIQYISPRIVVVLGLFGLAGVLFLYSRADSIGEIYALYALLGPCYASAHVVIVVVLVRQYFASHRILATSAALSGTSLGSAILPGIAVFLNESHGWRGALDQLMLLPLIVTPIVVYLLFRRGPMAAIGEEKPEPARSGKKHAPVKRSVMNLILLAVSTFGVFFASTSILLNLFLYMSDIGMSAQLAAAGLSTVFSIGLVAKVIVGAAAERWGLHRVWLSQQGALLIGALLLTSAIPAAVFPSLVLIGLGWAGCFVLTQVTIADYFAGPKLARMTGVFIVFEAISSGSGVWVGAHMRDLFGSYTPAFVLNCSTIVMALIAGALFTRAQLAPAADATPLSATRT
jgi:MFS family permease